MSTIDTANQDQADTKRDPLKVLPESKSVQTIIEIINKNGKCTYTA